MNALNQKAEKLRLERTIALRSLKENLLVSKSNFQIPSVPMNDLGKVIEFIQRRPLLMISFLDVLTSMFLDKNHRINQLFSLVKPIRKVVANL